MAQITESQEQKMKHTLGLDYKDKPYRNRYIVYSRNEELDELVDMGLMTRRQGPFSDFIYFVTEYGAKFLGVKLPQQ